MEFRRISFRAKKGMADSCCRFAVAAFWVVVLSNLTGSYMTSPPCAPAHRRYREPLLRAGVELWELKPNVEIRVAAQHNVAAPHPNSEEPMSTLHAKVLIFEIERNLVRRFF